MKNIEKTIQDAWLGIDIDENNLFNPMDFVYSRGDTQKIMERISWLMMRPEYFYFTCKH